MYAPPWFLFDRHLETIYPALLRSVNLKEYDFERISTPDNDFLDLYWLRQRSKNIVIISHGLEGNSKRAYVRGMAKVFFEDSFDVLAWDYRGCGEEMNKTLRFYHSGATEDLDHVVNHAIDSGYEKIFLIGFSLGGNLTLKYVGERNVSSQIKGVVTFSVPMDLYTSSLQISKPSNWIYSNRFLKSLKRKITTKSKLISGLSTARLGAIRTLQEFDDCYTGPLHGYNNAVEYYEKCSAINFLKNIKVPTLIVNAKNDPFLSKECFPEDIDNSFIQFETPERGGHVGFSQFHRNGLYWSEQRALDFVREQLG
jgi:predicted alpha/beta-fold hydrolase